MKMFTNNNNIFRVCVDNLKKLSYNVKRVLSRTRVFIAEMPKILLFILFFIMAIILSSFNADSAEKHTDGAVVVTLGLEIASFEGDGVLIAVRYDGSEELCGVMTTLRYDAASLRFEKLLRGEDLDSDGVITCALGDGCASIVLDSSRTLGRGELAVIRFSFVGDSLNMGDISLRGGFGNACVLRDGKVTRAYLSDDTSVCNMSPEDGVLSAELSVDGSGLRLRGITLRDCCFMGFDVTVTDIYSGNVQSFTVSSKTEAVDSGAFFATATLPVACSGRCVILIRSLCYGRESVDEGEEKIFLIYGGKIERLR